MDLPSSNMPPVLENMFKHLLNTYGHIRGWNIYENDRGFINLNIRFSSIVCEDSDSGSHARLEPVMYKRMSSQQISRNRSRAQSYKQQHNYTASQIKVDHTEKSDEHKDIYSQIKVDHIRDSGITKKRKCDSLSPELARTESIESVCDVNDLSPEVVSKTPHSTIYTSHPSSPILIQNMEYVDTSTSSCDTASPFMEKMDYVDSSSDTPPTTQNHETRYPSIPSPPHLATSPIIPLECDSMINIAPTEVPTPDTMTDTVLCPCCSAIMTVNHVCDLGDDSGATIPKSTDDPKLSSSDDPTPSNFRAHPSASSPSPPSPSSEPLDMVRIAAVLNAHTDKVLKNFYVKMGLPPP